MLHIKFYGPDVSYSIPKAVCDSAARKGECMPNPFFSAELDAYLRKQW